MKRIFLTLVLLAIMILPIFSNLIFVDHVIPLAGKTPKFDNADMAFMIVASALVMLMTPGLAFFYGGLVSRKNVVTTMLQSLLAMVIIAVLWVTVGYGLCYGPSIYGIIGDPTHHLFFQNVTANTPSPYSPTIPLVLFAIYQMQFAVITPALITGSFAERIRMWPYITFIVLFFLFIYAPITHSIWDQDGFFRKLGTIDFAGGTVVHMTAGWASLAAAIFLGRRKIQSTVPSHVPYVILGTGLLWFGWFGFNAGSAFGADPIAVQAFVNTAVAAAAGGMAWMFIDKIRGYEVTAIETCLGVLVGLISITPASGYVNTEHAIAIGSISSLVSYIVVSEFPKGIIDDALDVFGCHAIGGFTGMLLTGVFASKAVNPTLKYEGLLFDDASPLFSSQLIAGFIVSVFSFIMAYILFIVINLFSPVRVNEVLEKAGLDAEQGIAS
jgi:ammonium transporter, Amt family